MVTDDARDPEGQVSPNRQPISDEIWDQNYRAPGEECLMDTWERQAKACASVEPENIREKIYKDFLWLLTDFKGIAGGRITANLGVNDRFATTLYNCFVHAPGDINYEDPDSINGIYDMLKFQAHTLKSEGGYGMNFSWIRPAGSYVEGIGSRTPGVLKFMELWDKSSEIITSGSEKILGKKKEFEKNKIRKGAQMGVLNVWHPEIIDFITAKQTEGRLSKFNISVGITNGFMNAVMNDDDWELKFPDTTHEQYEKVWDGNINKWEKIGFPVIVYEKIRARDLWETIMKSTYNRNDPGVLFFDKSNQLNPLYYAEHICTTNPCGEINMSTGVCLLFSLNLVKFVKGNSDKLNFDFDLFEKAVKIATRFADNINDISRTPLPEYSKSVLQKRRIGLGVLGLGSLHYMLGIKFGSPESLDLIERIFKKKAETEILTSAMLGKEKGSFELFERDKYFNSHWWKNIPISDQVKSKVESIGEMRNSHHSANAPTGNMSIYAGCVSGGIEPVFMKQYARWSIVPEGERAALRRKGFDFPDVFKGQWFETDLLKEEKRGTDTVLVGKFDDVEYMIDKSRGLTKKTIVEDYGWSFAKTNFSDIKLHNLESQGVFVTTNDLTVKNHVDSLTVISKYVNMNSSKTVNIPNDYSYDDFKDLYLDAWKSNVKGITTYRAGTMTAVLESTDKKISPQEMGQAPRRPETLVSETHKIKVDFGDGELKNTYITVSFFPESRRPYEIFIQAPHQCLSDEKDLQILELTARNTSMNLRHGVPILYICEQLDKVGGQYLFSIPTNVSRILRKYINEPEENITSTDMERHDSPGAMKCPSCGARTYILSEGCGTCSSCGYSGCS